MPVHGTIPISKPPLNEKTVRELLKKADINGDGNLSKKELKKVFEEMGSNWPKHRTWLCMLNTDSDGDGEISASEMNKLVAYIMKWAYAKC
ncbi:hypothetical protein QN277_009591 [Acacia crassicarpa]|uniref:EF-hand domain-containing protein n=1 Tax=Acacia crassicarpa TaxID=499986 RepID=A0AAE1IQ65_9FABA|nr:hypothetical protein QN277_009591 [Acacia crassicarpa]